MQVVWRVVFGPPRGLRLLVAVALVILVTAITRRAAANPDDVMVLSPPPETLPSATLPTIGAAPDLSAFLGEIVATVDVAVDDTRWSDVRPPLVLGLRPGDRLTPTLVRAAIAEALASGGFSDAWVGASRDAVGGVRVVVHVMPRKIIEGVRLDAHDAPVDVSEIVRSSDLVTDGELVAREVPRHRARIEASLQRRGFPAPQVSISTQPTDDPRRVVVFVDVVAGAPRKVERRVFYPFGGTEAAADDARRAYTIQPGDRADETDLVAADRALESRIRSRGYYRAEVVHDVVMHRGLVVLRTRIDFQTQFETRYEGNEHYDKSTLDEALDLEKETDRTPNHLLQKVRDFYVKHGFLDAEVRIEQRGKADAAINYLVFHVEEGDRVTVATRAYPCLRESDLKRLNEGAPAKASAIGSEIDSFLEEELPGNELLVPPRASGVDESIVGPRAGGSGAHPAPLELDPDTAYVPETYERAAQHVQELYRAEGFLSAQVGPVQVLRRTCHPRSPPGECRPLKAPEPPDVCTYDAVGLPRPIPPLEPGSTCVPDPARGVRCEARVSLRIPVKLGPRTQLYDVAFSGVGALSPKVVAAAADVRLGSFASAVKLDEARRRIEGTYKEEGYAYVDVKWSLEPSPDHTRARVRFFVSEGDQVIVRRIVVKGNAHTRTAAIERRIALVVGQPYRASDIRKTEERVATLGAFSSVTVSLENPYVAQRNKVVVVSVAERPTQYTEVRWGFSTGEGIRLLGEYGHINLWGNAVQLTTRLQLSYIPTPLIIDPVARNNYRDLNLIARAGVRATGSMVFPDVGLGPLVRAGIDGILVHDLQRDFFITKLAAIPNTNYRPIAEFQISFFQSFELNNSRIFQSGTIDAYLQSLAFRSQNITDLVRQLLVPDGQSYVFSQRLLATWDRRDNAFNASRGTYVVSGIEHVDGFPVNDTERTDFTPPFQSHFFKFTQTFGGYVPLPKGLRIAALTRLGANVQLTTNSSTYPDRLFFLGGVDSMRGWNLNSFIPQDDVDRIFADRDKPDLVDEPTSYGPAANQVTNSNKFTAATRPIRGGNLMVNERVELRIPIKGPFETVIFGDFGNLWIDPAYPFRRGKFPIRAAVGSGLRVQTPVGPLAVDYGFNVTRESYEDVGAINFAIGLF